MPAAPDPSDTTSSGTALTGDVVVDENDGIATVLMARGDKHNALTAVMRGKLLEAFYWASEQSSVRAVVLRGEGRSFCAGQDIRGERAVFSSVQEGIWRREYDNLGQAIASCSVPVIAALHGHVLGRGLDIALAADLRVAAEGTKLAYPEVKHGITIGGGGCRRLVRAVGESRAMDLLLSGDSIDAATAKEWGILTRVVPQDQLDAEVDALAAKLAGTSGLALYATKSVVRQSFDTSVEAGSWTDTALNSLLSAEKDRAAAVKGTEPAEQTESDQ